MTHFCFHHSFLLSSPISAFITHFCFHHSFLPLWELPAPFPEGALWGRRADGVGTGGTRCGVLGRTVEHRTVDELVLHKY